MFTIILNGREVQAEKGETIYEVAQREGVYIPTLCYHDSVAPASVCRLCLVELNEGRRTRLVTACSYPIMRAGLQVQTDTERVQRNRRLILELLLARCPENEALQALAARLGVTQTRFAPGDPQEQCILCGLCERVCAQAVRVGGISRHNRGIWRRISGPFGDPPPGCIACGACAYVCPTGAITAAVEGRMLQIAPWGIETEMATCIACGQPFAPLAALEAAAAKLAFEPEYLRLCFSCRRQQQSQMLHRLALRRSNSVKE